MHRKDPETVVSCEGMVQDGAKEQKAVLGLPNITG